MNKIDECSPSFRLNLRPADEGKSEEQPLFFQESQIWHHQKLYWRVASLGNPSHPGREALMEMDTTRSWMEAIRKSHLPMMFEVSMCHKAQVENL